MDGVVAGLELRIIDDPLMQRDRGLDADDGELVERAAQPVDRVGRVGAWTISFATMLS